MLSGDALGWWNGLWMSGRDQDVTTWEELQKKLRARFLPPEGEMKVVGQWRRLQQTSTVASYFDYVFRLQAMCSMQKDADFRLAFYGLCPELQGEVRRYMRRNELQTLSLERLYEVAADAELSTGKTKSDKDMIPKRDELSHRYGREGLRFHGAKINQMGTRAPGFRLSSSERGVEGSRRALDIGEGRREYRREGHWGENKDREPCAVCDEWGHRWMTCTRRKQGKGCARCGATSHRLVNCPRRRRHPPKEVEKGGNNVWDRYDRRDEEGDSWGKEGKTGEGLVYNLGVSLPYEFQGLPRTQLLTYQVQVGKHKVKAMLDSGATVNVVSSDILEALGGIWKPTSEWVKFADGRMVPAKGVTEITLSHKGYVGKIRCLVLQGLSTELLLGRPWLQEWNPMVNWTTGELTFSDGIQWKPWNEKNNEVSGRQREFFKIHSLWRKAAKRNAPPTSS